MKSLGTRGRWAVYGIALLGTLAAVRWAGGQDDGAAAPVRERVVERSASAAGAANTPTATKQMAVTADAGTTLDVSRLGQRTAAGSERDLFPAVNWAQVAREEEIKRNPPPKPAPPPPPQAPPLPFTYMGRMIEDGKSTVFLIQGDRSLIVRQGETVQGSWRVDAIADQAMTFTYVPLNKQQTLSFAASAAMSPAGGAPAPREQESTKDD